MHDHILCKVNLPSVLATNSLEANTIISFLCIFYWICENTFTKCTAYAVYLCVRACTCVSKSDKKKKKKKKSSKGFKASIIKYWSCSFLRIVLLLTQLYGPLRLCWDIKTAAFFGNGWLKGTKRSFAYSCHCSKLFLIILIINYLKTVNELKSLTVTKYV